MAETKLNQSNITHDYSLSETAYSCGYDLRLKSSSFMQDSLQWISNNTANLLSGKTSRVLSLGCGNGLFDGELIKIIQQQKNNDWTFAGLDFSVTDLDYFRQRISMMDHKTQANISLQYKKFTPSTDLQGQYDLITMVHFLHSFEDVLPVIKNATQHLSIDGKLLIIQQKNRGMYELKKSFLDVLPNQKFQSSDHIKIQLQSENISFTSHCLSTVFDIAIMQKMSLDTLLLMSFCLSNDLSLLSTQQQDEMRNAFLAYGTKDKDGLLIFKEEMEVIIITSGQ